MRMVRLVPLFLILPLAGQQTGRESKTYVYDASGRRVEVAGVVETVSPGESRRTERVRSINGRLVPLESTEEKVVSQGPEGRVVERLVRRFDATGQPGLAEKTRIVEKKNADGTTTVENTVWRGDLNGRFRLHERSTTQSSKAGDTERRETVVERPSLAGTLEAVERRVGVETGGRDTFQSDVTTYRKDNNGAFSAAAREVVERRWEGGRSTETVTEYDATAPGRLAIAARRIGQKETQADGSTIEIVDFYRLATPGRPIDNAGPRLRERQIVERRPAADGSVVETLDLQRATLADPGKLGPVERISETRCTGDCAAPRQP
jgi:hypothetical protein